MPQKNKSHQPSPSTSPAATPEPLVRKEYKASYRVDPSFPRQAIQQGISGKVVASRLFQQSQPFDKLEPSAAVAAFNGAFGRIATDLIGWTVDSL